MFPCRLCLVRACCTSFCDTIEIRNRIGVSDLILKDICPDCGYDNEFTLNQGTSLYKIKCKVCKHEFKMIGKIFLERVKHDDWDI